MAVDYDSKSYFEKMQQYWNTANYLSVGQLFLRANPLLKKPLTSKDVKVKPIGHWGTIASQNFVYTHLNRVINKYDLNMFYIEGSGHGGQVMVSNSYMDGSYSEIYPKISQDEAGMARLFKQFSFPGGIASHAAPETPGSIHEGGELGYSLSHGVGAIFDNPDVIAAVEIGDGESETGPLAGSWMSSKFINPVTDGAVLPIINLNGYKIANPTVLARMTDEDITKYFEGMGWKPRFVETNMPYGTDQMETHEKLAKVMDASIEEIKAIQKNARENQTAETATEPKWPMIIFRSPKGWTGPKKNAEGLPIEGSFRAHQVPIPLSANDMGTADEFVEWMKSYKPEESFDENGTLKPYLRELAPKGNKRMSTNPITNGGIDPKPLDLPDYRDYALDIKTPGATENEDMVVWSEWLRDVTKRNPNNFRGFGPDETWSNRLWHLFDVTRRQWMPNINPPYDEYMAHYGRLIDSQLSEHQDEGWLEGYTLTGRHGFFATYEAFGRVVDSMLTQYFKWLRKASELEWRNKYPALNFIDSSTVFQQDHNGYTHQDPGMITHLSEKKPEFIREYFPADANTLLAVGNEAFDSYERINLITTSKHPRPQWFNIDEASNLVKNGLGYIDWASTDNGEEPDVVMASAGVESTLETLAAISILHKRFPEMKIRYINVVDLLKLRNPELDPRGISDKEFDQLFTKDKPVVFAFHGFEDIIRTIFFDRHNKNVHVHGYRENGDITTPFDMRVLNQLDRFNLSKEVVSDIPEYALKGTGFIQDMNNMLDKHDHYIREYGTDLPEVENWKWEPLRKPAKK
ncbi:phosphoketolase family protein [Fructilactobacillus fructivorans]|uniref:Probable phosphoketolase n=1 Tax=Fructilactobacillus fructivorans TaxID=1614 RepID=A0A0C1M4D8_9LACO|nr:phosphoketolase family protein [Fructilactobacillus fructivorans]KID41144.1 Xylulose-5-phosphate phosphoketolase [Fructilactobacillus fructivorans]MCT0151514.1 phosphoketolase family protein [Fructilactobacillus fructivorans]MCT2867033.1 phosphoketolase family protein [Fructilactobacillus fructivorans]MCT2869334.1 phosphoketolase family protein [Fructilactobacillus fructivorans]MCT2873629.1 phosphoketolase family protein [Fructilactobacillus fructivorans]